MWSDRLKGILGNGRDTEALATTILGATLAVAVVMVVVLAIAPVGTSTSYTAFYVLGQNGTASDYPENVTIGEVSVVRVGIQNVESRQQTYSVIARTNETTVAKRTVMLEPDEQWEDAVPLTFDSPGRKQLRLELYLGQTPEGEAYRSLKLFINVSAE